MLNAIGGIEGFHWKLSNHVATLIRFSVEHRFHFSDVIVSLHFRLQPRLTDEGHVRLDISVGARPTGRCQTHPVIHL